MTEAITPTAADPFLAAVIQMSSGAEPEANLARAEQLMDQAVSQGSGLLVLPEHFNALDDPSQPPYRERFEASRTLGFLSDYAAAHGVWIVGGSLALAIPDSDKVTNTSFVIDHQGAIQARYHKIHLFDVALGPAVAKRDVSAFQESSSVAPGTTPVTANTPFGTIGLSVCYDLRFPELYRRLAAQGASLLTVPAAFTLNTGKDHWELLLRARAVENFSYVLAAGQWGKHPGGRRTYGHSMIVEPWGTVIARVPDGEGVAVAEIDPARIRRCRKRIPCLTHRVL
ncbi:MAG: carbon-nitrogen hydrolase family protein [Magnetococcales bacterium]|nr:carbon-nitrogen hydrolase family protein [Magnetococcales bacterium]